MNTAQQADRSMEDGPMAIDTRKALIGKQVLQTLGSPGDILKVKVHPMGNDRYRVNVLVGKDVTTARIANSFFLTADSKGNIVTSSPKIVRLY